VGDIKFFYESVNLVIKSILIMSDLTLKVFCYINKNIKNGLLFRYILSNF